MNLIVAAIPLFLILIIIELTVDRLRNTRYYRFNDAINSLNIGIFSRVTGILKAAIPISIYFILYDNYALFTLDESSVLVWVFAFVAYDLAYYWSHRLNHRIGVMWGSHVVHHSSEEYNLTTALRQTSTPSLLGWTMFLPLSILGVPPEVAIACGALNLIYQFWVHTRHINKMPKWFEAVMVTPSHHRVHHALNRQYIDKNYAGVFIFWDKIFDSFQQELDDVEIVYGVSHQLKSWNPLWANVQVYYHLLLDFLGTKSWRDKCKVWFKPPGWRPEDVNKSHPRPYVTTKTMKKYDVTLSSSIKGYLLAQYLIFLVLTAIFLTLVPTLSYTMILPVCFLATMTLVVISGIQEQKTWSLWLEPIRIVSSCALFYWFMIEYQTTGYVWLLSMVCLISLMLFYAVNASQWAAQKAQENLS